MMAVREDSQGEDDTMSMTVFHDRAGQEHVKLSPMSFAQEGLWFLDQLEPGSAVSSIPFLKGQNQVARDCVRQVMHWIRIESVLIWVHVDTLCGEDEIAFQQFSVVSKIEIGFAAHFLAEIINPGLLLECVSFD